MRLDRYLKITRLVPRRGGAKELCDTGQAMINGQPAKAGRKVRGGERILLRFPGRELLVEVVAIPDGRSVPKAAAREFYRILEQKHYDLWGREVPS